MLTRIEFIEYMKKACGGSLPDGMWIPEEDLERMCVAFVCIKPIGLRRMHQDDYWIWCTNNLSGFVRCFSSSDSEEWWGFTEERDTTLWTLRWAN